MAKRLIRFVFDNSILLIVGAATAVAWANIDAAGYHQFVHLRLQLGRWSTSLQALTNDVLMALFFGLAGKQIWQAMLPGGPFHHPRHAMVPLASTLGGMAAPALVYVLGAALLGSIAEAGRGWAIPCATDVAFSYMIARLVFGRHHPAIPFLLLLAIADDFGGLFILGVFYTAEDVHLAWLLLAVLAVALGLAFKAMRVRGWWWYVLIPGVISWIGFSLSGVRPALGLLPIIPTLPITNDDADGDDSDAAEAEHTLHLFERHLRNPVEVILGLFGLLNAGVAFSACRPVTFLVLAGLLVGKPLGIWTGGMLTSRIFRTGLPEGLNARDLLVLGCSAAIGFTVSLFVTTVAFPSGATQDAARLGALASLLAVIPTFIAARLLGVTKRDEPPPAREERSRHALDP